MFDLALPKEIRSHDAVGRFAAQGDHFTGLESVTSFGLSSRLQKNLKSGHSLPSFLVVEIAAGGEAVFRPMNRVTNLPDLAWF